MSGKYESSTCRINLPWSNHVIHKFLPRPLIKWYRDIFFAFSQCSACYYHCWFHGSSFKGFSIVFPAPWLAEVESSQKTNGMWFFKHFFAPYLFHRSRNNRFDKLRSKFWREKMFRKPYSKLLRWFSVDGTNKPADIHPVGCCLLKVCLNQWNYLVTVRK